MYIALTTLPIERFIPSIRDAGLSTIVVRGQGSSWSDFHRLVLDSEYYPDKVAVLSLDDTRFVHSLDLAYRSHIPVAWITDPNAPYPAGYLDMMDYYQNSPVDHSLDSYVVTQLPLPQGISYDAYMDESIARVMESRQHAMLNGLMKRSMSSHISDQYRPGVLQL